MTNIEKFEEVFGFRPFKGCISHEICDERCPYFPYDRGTCNEIWWDEPYGKDTVKASTYVAYLNTLNKEKPNGNNGNQQ